MLQPLASHQNAPIQPLANNPHWPLIIVGDREPLTNAIEKHWQDRGYSVQRFEWLAEPLVKADFLAGLILVAPADHVDVSRRAFAWIKAAGSALRKAAQAHTAALIAVTRLGGDFGLQGACHNPLSAGLAGLVKTARHEWPSVACRVIDVADDPEVFHRAALETKRLGPIEMGITIGGLCELQLRAVEPPACAMGRLLKPGELVIISGGAKGVTAMAALALAEKYQPTLLLLGRSALPGVEPDWLRHLTAANDIKKGILDHAESALTPKQVNDEYQQIIGNREITANLQRLRDAGATVEYHAVDIRNSRDLNQIVADARRRFGPVRGILHGAGVLADRKIEDKTIDQFDRVYQTKVEGLQSLLHATAVDDLKFIALYSSSTARFGRIGQCDYAAANEVMNATARRLRHERPQCRVVSLNWGPWEGGMVTPALKTLFETEGVGLIPLTDGGQFLVNELNLVDGPTDLVVLGRPPANYSLELTPQTHPWLTDHQLNGQPVLPLAVMIEAFLQSVPPRECTGIQLENLRVRRPIVMKHADHLRLQLAIDTDQRQLTLENGEPVTRPTVTARWSPKQIPTAHADRSERLTPFPLTVSEAYEQVLFHGPRFQCISSIVGYSDRGIRVRAQSSPRQWRWWKELAAADRRTDPLVIDAGLQAIILWAWAERGELSLPIGVGKFVAHVSPFPSGECEIDVVVTTTKAHLFHANVTISDAAGQLLAELSDCEFVATPDMARAFGKMTPIAVGAR